MTVDPSGRPGGGGRVPSLNLFRAFEAVARHRSVRLAALELCVTPSAVSQQVRHLEDFLRTRLLRRLPRGIALTQDGVLLAADMQQALAIMGRACNRLLSLPPASPAPSSPVIVHSVAAFASRWLMPRLSAFMDAHPEIHITLLTANGWCTAPPSDADLAIRWGTSDIQGWDLEVLGHEKLIAVCSPTLCRRLNTPADLRAHRGLMLIGSDDWAAWFAQDGNRPVSFRSMLQFSDPGLMLDAAVQGQGVCLVPAMLAEQDLRARRLVQPFPRRVPTVDPLVLLTRTGASIQRPVALVAAWLREQTAQSAAASTPAADVDVVSRSSNRFKSLRRDSPPPPESGPSALPGSSAVSYSSPRDLLIPQVTSLGIGTNHALTVRPHGSPHYSS